MLFHMSFESIPVEYSHHVPSPASVEYKLHLKRNGVCRNVNILVMSQVQLTATYSTEPAMTYEVVIYYQARMSIDLIRDKTILNFISYSLFSGNDAQHYLIFNLYQGLCSTISNRNISTFTASSTVKSRNNYTDGIHVKETPLLHIKKTINYKHYTGTDSNHPYQLVPFIVINRVSWTLASKICHIYSGSLAVPSE